MNILVHKLHTATYTYLALFFKKIYLFIQLHWVLVAACGIFSCSTQDLIPPTRIESRTPVLGAQSFSHWTTREVPGIIFKDRLLELLNEQI